VKKQENETDEDIKEKYESTPLDIHIFS